MLLSCQLKLKSELAKLECATPCVQVFIAELRLAAWQQMRNRVDILPLQTTKINVIKSLQGK